MTQFERVFFRLVCEECISSGKITEDWVMMYVGVYGGWTYEKLLEYLDSWARDGMYDYVEKIANGRLAVDKLRGEYRAVYHDVLREVSKWR